MEEISGNTEKNYRMNFKQTAKGVWSAEFTVRADGINELKERFQLVKGYVSDELKLLNFRGEINKIDDEDSKHKNRDPKI